MPKITFVISESGELSTLTEGIKGKACKPIHAAIAADLKAALGLEIAEAHDTPEANESAERVTTTIRNRQSS